MKDKHYFSHGADLFNYDKQVFDEKYNSSLFDVYVLFYCLGLHYVHLISQAIIRPNSGESNSACLASHNFNRTSDSNVTFRSIPVHLSFNFYRSCQGDYRQALSRSSA